MKKLMTLLALPLLFACQPKEEPGQTATSSTQPPASTAPTRDPHSYSHPDEARVEHLVLDIDVDFAKKEIRGTATLNIKHAGAKSLVLDTRDLTIKKVTLQPGGANADFKLAKADPILGQALEIPINADTTAVTVEYATSPKAAALQWLDPAQTAGKKHPFLLSQSQAILARTWVPIQDTPMVRITYEATVRVPKDLLALMGAENPQTKNDSGVYHFTMPQKIPSYLLVISVGDIAFRPLSDNCGVYAEVPVVDKAANEFVDTPKMIATASELYGPYRWGRYDMLVLPPSFPYGGMENPRLTFLTPTMIAGDRSLVSLIGHVLAHSWSGNLVTNATWNDFWLNEGVTTYIERRISEKLYGKDFAEMQWTLGYSDLKDEFARLPAGDTALYINWAGRDPDEGATQVPYEKGSMFLRLIENTVGREAFDKFLRGYFDHFAFQSITTDQFREYLRAQFPGIEEKVNAKAWLYGPGLPSNAPLPHAEGFVKVEEQAKAYGGGTAASSLKTDDWKSYHWVHFIESLPSLTPERMAELDARFHFSDSGNAEVLSAWLNKSIDARYKGAYPAIERFLTSMGRRKFLRPIYTKLAAHPEDLEFAKKIYAKARPGYHSVSQATIDEILKWKG